MKAGDLLLFQKHTHTHTHHHQRKHKILENSETLQGVKNLNKLGNHPDIWGSQGRTLVYCLRTLDSVHKTTKKKSREKKKCTFLNQKRIAQRLKTDSQMMIDCGAGWGEVEMLFA